MLSDGKHPVVEIRHGDGRDMPIPSVDVIYLDPARRAGDGSRVYAIEDCEPNVIEWQDELLNHAKTVLVKLSPMVDMTDALRKLRNVTDIYIVAVKNECKEVLAKMRGAEDKGQGARSEEQAHGLGGSLHVGCVMVHCVDFLVSGKLEYFFNHSDGMEVLVSNEGVKRYLYEPDVTLMKALAFGSLCHRFSVSQLDYDTHLMTSDQLIPDFAGRIFEVKEQFPFSSKNLKRLKHMIPQANIATRNFPLSTDELRRRTGIRDGGNIYLFGAKVKGEGDVLLKCIKVR